jgi:hypothetical protein
MTFKTWINGLGFVTGAIAGLVVKQDAQTLAAAGLFFILLSNLIPLIFKLLTIILPPVLMAWGLLHVLLAGWKIGSRLFHNH